MRTITRRAALAAALALIACATVRPVAAGFVIDINRVGPDVVATGSGTIDLAGLEFVTNGPVTTGIQPDSAAIVLGRSGVEDDFYSGLTGPSSFGPGASTPASSGSGALFGFSGLGGFLAVPGGYVSGTSLTDTITFANATFGSLGVTPGTYTFTLPNDTIVLKINGLFGGGPPAVPEPSSLVLTGVGALIGAGAWYRRRRPVEHRNPHQPSCLND